MENPDTEALFRRRAIAAIAEPLRGRPIARMPRPWRWLLILLLVASAVSATFAVRAEYARKASARGWLVANDGGVRIAHSTYATVVEVLRSSGDLVHQGDPLLRLSTDTRLPDGLDMSERLLQQVSAELAETDMQVSLLEQQHAAAVDSLRQQLSDLSDEQQAILAEQQQQQRIVAVAHEQHARVAVLQAVGNSTEWEVMQHEASLATAERESARLRRVAIQLQRSYDELSAALQALPSRHASQLSEQRSQRTRLLQRVAQIEAGGGLIITAPINGSVGSVAASAGDVVSPQQLLMSILPSEYELKAELFVVSGAIGFLQHGQQVQLSYDAFPARSFGYFDGTVERVSDFVLLPGEIPQTFSVREATYKVEVTLQQSAVNTLAGLMPLRPGMLLQADIVLESRSLAHWLLEPLRLNQRRAQ